MRVAALVCCIFLVGCANAGIVQLSKDTYAITGSNFQGIFTNVSALKAKTVEEANAFAESHGKVAVMESYKLHRPLVGGFTSVKYQFKLVDKKDIGKVEAPVEESSDVDVQKDGSHKDENAKNSDLYTELMKLEELRKKNILTEEEFQVQKKRLLEAQK
jgi:hypothetical protein